MNVIILPVFSFEDVAYGIYYTSVRIAIAYEYGCDVYSKALEKVSPKMTLSKIRSFVCGVRKQGILFDAVKFQRRCRENPFVIGDACLTTLSQHVQYIFAQHVEK